MANNTTASPEETASEIARALKLRGGESLRSFDSKLNEIWVRLYLMFLILPLLLFADVACKVWGGYGYAAVAAFSIPLFTLLILGRPAFQIAFTILGAFFSGKRGVRASLAEGIHKYWEIAGVVLLWSTIVPLGIFVAPIQNVPMWIGGPFTLIAIFVIALLAHQLAYWQKWHTTEEYSFQRGMLKGLKVFILSCVALPFYFAGIDMYRGVDPVRTMEQDRAANEVKRAENATLECMAKVDKQRGKDAPPDWIAYDACKTMNQPVLPRNHSEKQSAVGEDGASGGKLPSWVPEWMAEWGWVQWLVAVMGGTAALVVLHAVLLAPFLALLGFAGYKIVKIGKENKATAKKDSSSEVGLFQRLFWILLFIVVAVGSWHLMVKGYKSVTQAASICEGDSKTFAAWCHGNPSYQPNENYPFPSRAIIKDGDAQRWVVGVSGFGENDGLPDSAVLALASGSFMDGDKLWLVVRAPGRIAIENGDATDLVLNGACVPVPRSGRDSDCYGEGHRIVTGSRLRFKGRIGDRGGWLEVEKFTPASNTWGNMFQLQVRLRGERDR